jgi:NTE family protein
MPRLTLALLPLLLTTACAHFPEKGPLPQPVLPSEGYRFETLRSGPENTDSLVVCLSLSGGGTRAGAMAYGVIRTLDLTRIGPDAKPFLDELDIISAASGGSFPAAYYGAFGVDAFLSDFRERVLLRDLGMEMFWRAALCPYNLVRLCSPWFNRSDLAAELYQDSIFGNYNFSHLQDRGRPFVVLNATNLQAGTRFEFTQDQFDELGSSLAGIQLGRAVAASAAFPVLLTPVAFRDDTADALRYVHLIDGGVVDNLGLGYVLESYQRGALRDLIAAGKVETLVFVVVNARNHASEDMNASPQAPGAASVLSYGLGAAIDRRGDDQGRLLADLSLRGTNDTPGAGANPVVHLVEIDLEDLPDPEQRERLLAVETTFGLEEEVVDELIEAAAWLLSRNPVWAHVKAELQLPGVSQHPR